MVPAEMERMTDDQKIANLYLMCARMVRKLRYHDPDCKMATQACGLMDRMDVRQNILRATEQERMEDRGE